MIKTIFWFSCLGDRLSCVARHVSVIAAVAKRLERSTLHLSREITDSLHGMVRATALTSFSRRYYCCILCILCPPNKQAAVVALKVEHLVWDVKAMGAGLSMGQLDTLKAFLLAQVARVDEAKARQTKANACCSVLTNAFFSRFDFELLE